MKRFVYFKLFIDTHEGHTVVKIYSETNTKDKQIFHQSLKENDDMTHLSEIAPDKLAVMQKVIELTEVGVLNMLMKYIEKDFLDVLATNNYTRHLMSSLSVSALLYKMGRSTKVDRNAIRQQILSEMANEKQSNPN